MPPPSGWPCLISSLTDFFFFLLSSLRLQSPQHNVQQLVWNFFFFFFFLDSISPGLDRALAPFIHDINPPPLLPPLFHLTAGLVLKTRFLFFFLADFPSACFSCHGDGDCGRARGQRLCGSLRVRRGTLSTAAAVSNSSFRCCLFCCTSRGHDSSSSDVKSRVATDASVTHTHTHVLHANVVFFFPPPLNRHKDVAIAAVKKFKEEALKPNDVSNGWQPLANAKVLSPNQKTHNPRVYL